MTAPRQTGSHASNLLIRPNRTNLIQVGDLCAKMSDGSACSASGWPRQADRSAVRRDFAAHFGVTGGVSDTTADPARPKVTPLTLLIGGSWIFDVAVKVEPGTPLGPYIRSDGSLDSQKLEACPPDEAVGVATAEGVDLYPLADKPAQPKA